MKSKLYASILFSVLTANCFAGIYRWFDTSAGNDWTSTSSWKDENGNTWTDFPNSSTSIAILDYRNYDPGSNSSNPSVNANISLQQLQVHSDWGASTVALAGTDTSVISFTTSGAVTDTVTADNAQFIYSGQLSEFAVSLSVPSGGFVRVLDAGGSGIATMSYTGSDTTKSLFTGIGTVVVGPNTSLRFDQSATSSDYAEGFMFAGTINLPNSDSSVFTSDSKGPIVHSVTGTNPSSYMLINSDVELQNTHSFQGATRIYGKTLTLADSLTVSGSGGNVTYQKGDLGSSPIVFEYENPALVIQDATSVGGFFVESSATSPTINLNANTLTINQSVETLSYPSVNGTSNFGGVISGTGNLVYAGSSSLELSGDNTFTGSITQSSGTLTMSGTTLHAGATTINGGMFVANADITSSSALAINSGATLKGTGTYPATTIVAGIHTPGNSIGTQNFSGNYSIDADSTTKIEFSPYLSSLIAVTGTTGLDGTLTWIPQKGIYTDGTSIPFLTSTGAITGTYAAVTGGANFSPVYSANGVSILTTGHHVNPHPVHPGHHNSHHIHNHITGDLSHITFNGDIVFVINAAMNHYFTTAEASDALFRLTGAIYHAWDRVNAQTLERKARSVDEMFISHAETSSSLAMKSSASEHKSDSSNSNRKEFRSVYGQNETSFYFEPYGVIYHQGSSSELVAEGQVPFLNETIGFGGGYELAFNDNYVFEIGAGYSFSAIQWENNFGHGFANSIYLAPFMGWYDDTSFVNGMLLGQCNFNDVQRKVTFVGLDASARGKYVSYDLMLRLNGGHRWAVHRADNVTDWLQAESTLNYINMFTPELKETSDKSLGLKIKSKTQLLLQPRLIGKWIHEIVTPNYILAPVFKMGWVGTYQLNEQKHHAKFALSPVDDHFISTGHEHLNQMMVGGELFYKSPRNYKVTTGFETLFLDHTAVLEGSVKWEWIF